MDVAGWTTAGLCCPLTSALQTPNHRLCHKHAEISRLQAPSAHRQTRTPNPHGSLTLSGSRKRFEFETKRENLSSAQQSTTRTRTSPEHLSLCRDTGPNHHHGDARGTGEQLRRHGRRDQHPKKGHQQRPERRGGARAIQNAEPDTDCSVQAREVSCYQHRVQLLQSINREWYCCMI